jgi:hypothetical protein
MAGGGVAVFLVASGIAVTIGGVLARWLGWIAVALGVLVLFVQAAAGPIAAVRTLLLSSVLLLSRKASQPIEPATADPVLAI